MILATIFSLCIGYLARLRHRMRAATDQIQTKSQSEIVDTLKPHIVIRDGEILSTNFLYQPAYIRRELAVSIFLKFSTLFIFLTVVWWSLAVNLPVWSKWVIGALVAVMIWLMFRSFQALGEIRNLVNSRSEFLIYLSFYLIVNTLTIYTNVFPHFFSLLVVGVMVIVCVFRALNTKRYWFIPAVYGLAMFQPLILSSPVSFEAILYLVGISSVVTASLIKTASNGTGLLVSLSLIFFSVILYLFPAELIIPATGWLIFFAFTVNLVGLTFLLYRANSLLSWPVLTSLIWWIGVGFVLMPNLSMPALAWSIITILLLGLSYRWSMFTPSVNAPMVLGTLSVISIFLAATKLFSGSGLVSIFILFTTVLITLVTWFGLPRRVVWSSVAIYLILFCLSMRSTISTEWSFGIWHDSAINLYVLLSSLVWLSGWLLHRRGLEAFGWRDTLSLLFGLLTIISGYIVAALVLEGIFKTEVANVMLYVSGALISLMVVYYSIRQNLPDVLQTLLAATWLLPAHFSLASLRPADWSQLTDNLAVFGVSWIFSLGVLIVLLLTQRNRNSYSSLISRGVSVGAFLLLGYLCLILYALVFGQIPNLELATVVYANALALIIIMLFRATVALNLSSAWQTTSLLFLVLPIFGVSQFIYNRNPEEYFSTSLTSFGLIILITLLIWLLRQIRVSNNLSEYVLFSQPLMVWRNLLAGVIIIFSIGYSWTLVHSILPTSMATTVSFFLIGSVGLYLFERGAERTYRNWRLVGALMLISLVINFLFFDLWKLPDIWRAVVSIILAGLFLIGAWYEKKSLSTPL